MHQVVPEGDPGEHLVYVLVLFSRGFTGHAGIIDEARAIVNCGEGVGWSLKHEGREKGGSYENVVMGETSQLRTFLPGFGSSCFTID